MSTDKIAREFWITQRSVEFHEYSNVIAKEDIFVLKGVGQPQLEFGKTYHVREVLTPDPRDEELEKLRDELKEAREVIKSIAGDLKCEEFIDVDFWENYEDTALAVVNDTKIAREYLMKWAAE